ncbi:hypothetical protein EST38_g12560 [Candolleomyces aberdarensis]|uniref:F-box domain-containing protein n=1 Tax=Candolleomyces aberdarensis TaxID=2316362 RepID=A0A4Q2D4M4_9AGAR|nr:hypothetical protein EST38_g12560 [Candolleomyces aberdarensis]
MSSTEDRLESLSTSNRPPSPQESSVAGELQQLCDQKLRVMDTRIAALDRELEDLKAQRAIIKGERDQYADILSARRLLPPEIIGRFMELACLDDNPSSHSLGAYQQVSSFMLVSREWYRTACGVAHFWTELDMNFMDSSAEDTQNGIVKAVKRSARASELPLSLKIAFAAATPTNTRIVEFIHSQVSRLGLLSLRLQVDSIRDLQILDTLFHHSPSSSAPIWPRLHSLRISIQSENDITVDSELSVPVSNFPLLSTAAISSSNVTFAQYQLAWSNLLRLDLGPLRQLKPRQYLSILKECPNLRFLHLRMHHQANSNRSGNLPATTLPNLTHFEFENTDSQEVPMGQILSQLTLPSLQSCTYTILDEGGYYTTIIRKLAELFQRSRCLQSMKYLELNLSRGLANNDTLDTLFGTVPQLTVLKLSGHKMDPDTLDEVPPSVRDLTIKSLYYRIDDARDSFIDYLNSRVASSDVPMKAQLHLADTTRTFALRERLDSLRKNVGSSLDVVMD